MDGSAGQAGGAAGGGGGAGGTDGARADPPETNRPEANLPDAGRGADAGDAPPVVAASCPVAISGGRYHACANKRNGTLWCWGANNHDQLPGGGSQTPVEMKALGGAVAEVSASYYGTCARMMDGTLWCWGENAQGQVGDGTQGGTKPSPVQVTVLGTGVAGVAAAREHTCARKSDGTLWCWGRNSSGRLGNGTMTDSLRPVEVTGLGNAVVDVQASNAHTCARKTDGTLWCWGGGGSGQVGDGSLGDEPSPVQVIVLGANVVEVATGGAHTCARKGDGTLWCWGLNSTGQVGDGTKMNRSSPVQVTALGADVRGVAAGITHTCARKGDGTLWCWGHRRLRSDGRHDSDGAIVAHAGGGGRHRRDRPRNRPVLHLRGQARRHNVVLGREPQRPAWLRPRRQRYVHPPRGQPTADHGAVPAPAGQGHRSLPLNASFTLG